MIRFLIAIIMLLPTVAFAGQGMFPLPMVYVSGGGGLICTGSESVISGDTESFEYGASDFCSSDITISGATGLNTYDSAWSNSGTYSASFTDSSSTANPVIYADNGSAITTKYVRFYLKVPDVADYALMGVSGIGKYNSSIQVPISIYDGSTGAGGDVIRVGGNTSEYIPVTAGDTVRVEYEIYDADGSGAGYPIITVKAYTSAGLGIETTNGVGDYEISFTGTYDAARYIYMCGTNNDSSSITAYVDDWKICNSWCGGE